MYGEKRRKSNEEIKEAHVGGTGMALFLGSRYGSH